MKRTCLPVILLALFLGGPVPAAERGQAAPSGKDKCPVCGMFVAKYPAWTCRIVFRDGSSAWFDGARDLFTYYLDMKRYSPSRSRSDVASMFVKDYYSTAFVDAFAAFYVVGSDVTGPMGAELVPFGKADDAAAFMKDHNGRKVLGARDVSPALLKALP